MRLQKQNETLSLGTVHIFSMRLGHWNLSAGHHLVSYNPKAKITDHFQCLLFFIKAFASYQTCICFMTLGPFIYLANLCMLFLKIIL